MTAAILERPGALTTLKLRDGRTLGYSVCGAAAGHPVLFFHPIQGNRFMALTMHEAAEARNLRVLALDRPGIGESSQLPGRSVAAYPADVLELCQQLGIQRFSVMASSAGTMYALACSIDPATKDMLQGKITIVAPWIAPSSRPGSSSLMGMLAVWTPLPLLRAFVGFSNGTIVKQSRTRPVTDLMTRSNEQEKAAFAAQPGNDAIFKAMINEWNASLPGIMQEMQLCTERSGPLHFQYHTDIQAPVRVFMGTADKILKYRHVQDWAAKASNVELISVPGGTHDGIMHTHKVVALEALANDLQHLSNTR